MLFFNPKPFKSLDHESFEPLQVSLHVIPTILNFFSQSNFSTARF